VALYRNWLSCISARRARSQLTPGAAARRSR